MDTLVVNSSRERDSVFRAEWGATKHLSSVHLSASPRNAIVTGWGTFVLKVK